MDKKISIMELVEVLKNKALFIIILMFLGFVLSIGYTFFIATPQYTATTQLLVNQSRGEQVELELIDMNTNVLLIDTYTELIKGPAVLNVVSDELGGSLTSDQLSSMIVISAPQNALLFNLTITHINPVSAAEIANIVAATFKDEIGEIMNSVDSVVITYPAEPKLDPISPNHLLNVLIGTISGATLAILISLLKYGMDDTLRETEFITEVIGWNDLGSINEIKPKELESPVKNGHTSTSSV